MSLIGPPQEGVSYPGEPTASHVVDVSTSDVDLTTIFLAGFARWIECGESGTIAVQKTGDSAPVVFHVVAGQVLEGHFVKVAHSGTSITDIVASN